MQNMLTSSRSMRLDKMIYIMIDLRCFWLCPIETSFCKVARLPFGKVTELLLFSGEY